MTDILPSYSRMEQCVFLWFHNCPCGGELKLVERTSSSYKGKRLDKIRSRCAQCGEDVIFVFDCAYNPDHEPEPGHINPPETTSVIVDPLQWLHGAAHFLHLTDDEGPAISSKARAALVLNALGCVREALKFIPQDGQEIPRAALRGKLSRAFARQNPDSLKRVSLERMRDRLSALAASLGAVDSTSWWELWEKTQHSAGQAEKPDESESGGCS